MNPGKRSIIACILTLVMFRPSLAAFEDMPAGARMYGFAGAASACFSYENLFYNPAGIWRDAGIQMGAFTGKLFGLDELQYGSFAGVFHVRRVTCGLGAQAFGKSNYRESTVCAGLCYKIDQFIYIGAAARYVGLAIKGYGQAVSVLADIGGIIKPHPRLQWGWVVRNFGYAAIGQCREKLPQSIITGVQILPVKAVKMNLELYKDTRFPVDYRCGAEIEPVAGLRVSSGFATTPSRFTAGFGLNWQWLAIDYAFNTHPYLDITHLFSLVFTREK
ncbi:MAG TPA: hypothetical protein PLP19_21255 [bacterium]|nr:hypothetical protein [bacterium]HPN46025.1 hypothetical protein [bacterium]